jgi:hypothetical protein
MGQKNTLKIVSVIAFIALASVSCWATQESLHLLLESWPQFLCWIVTIAFFIIASLGTKLIVDSLNQNVYVVGRGKKLIGGILILLFFWLIFSMPTNTHTFFYRSSIESITSSDISTTKGYLDQLKNNTLTETKIRDKQTEFSNQVWSLFADLESEIRNDANPGFGPNAKRILSNFATLLEVNKVEPLSYNDKSEQGRVKLVDAYRTKIDILMQTKLTNIRNSMIAPDEEIYKAQASTDWQNLDFAENMIKSGDVDLNNASNIKDVNNRLVHGYSTIKTYSNYIDFNTGDKEQYLPTNEDGSPKQAVTKVERMLSVFDVWKDFLNGKYAGRGLIIWVLLSILVDIGAFVFFDIAFKKDQYTI